MTTIRSLLMPVFDVWFRYLRWHQRHIAVETQCAYPNCRHEWKGHFAGVRMCRHHHPEINTPLYDVLTAL